MLESFGYSLNGSTLQADEATAAATELPISWTPIYYVMHRFFFFSLVNVLNSVIYRWNGSATAAAQARSEHILWQFTRQQPRYVGHCFGLMQNSSLSLRIRMIRLLFAGLSLHTPDYYYFSHIWPLRCCLEMSHLTVSLCVLFCAWSRRICGVPIRTHKRIDVMLFCM